jgi:hypothetical protein
MPHGIHRDISSHPAEIATTRQPSRSARSKANASFPITVSVVDPILPLDAKALLDIIQVRAQSSKSVISVFFALI